MADLNRMEERLRRKNSRCEILQKRIDRLNRELERVREERMSLSKEVVEKRFLMEMKRSGWPMPFGREPITHKVEYVEFLHEFLHRMYEKIQMEVQPWRYKRYIIERKNGGWIRREAERVLPEG